MQRSLLASIAAAALVGCHEIPQDAAKPFAGPAETKGYSADRFKGDRAAYEKALAERAETQNEYLRIGNPDK